MSEPKEIFTNVPEGSIDAFVAQAELMLAGTVQVGIASDSKATTLMGVYGAITVALAVTAATMLAAQDAERFHALISPCAVSSAIMLVSVLCLARAAEPADFYVGGYQPKLLATCARNRTWMMRYVAADLQLRIEDNRKALQTTARWTRRAMAFALLAIIFGVGAFMVSYR